MPEFRVKWEIDIVAETAFEAAYEAWRIQQDPASHATVFDVFTCGSYSLQQHRFETIDLMGEKVKRERGDN